MDVTWKLFLQDSHAIPLLDLVLSIFPSQDLHELVMFYEIQTDLIESRVLVMGTKLQFCARNSFALR